MEDDNGYTPRSLLQYLIFALLLMILVSPFLYMLWKNTAYRVRLWDIFFCTQWRVYYDEADLRTIRELEQPPHQEGVGINGAYRMYQARRARSLLRLTSWREDVKHGDNDRLHKKLALIQATRCQQNQSVAAGATITSRTSANPVISTCTSQSSISSVAMSSHSREIGIDSDDESMYELIALTPKNELSSRNGRRPVVGVEEEEKKEDVTQREIESI